MAERILRIGAMLLSTVLMLLALTPGARADDLVQPVMATGPNLVPNGDFEFEMGLHGWNASGSTIAPNCYSTDCTVRLADVAGGRTGDRAVQVTNVAGGAVTCALNDSPDVVATTAAGPYEVALWARDDGSGGNLRLRVREYAKGSGALAGSETAALALTSSWQRVALSYTPAEPGRSSLDLSAFVAGAPPGTCFLADDVSVTLPSSPSTPNLVADPGFEGGVSGWNTSGSEPGTELRRAANDLFLTAQFGDWGGEIVDTSAPVRFGCTLNDSPNVIGTTGSGTYTASLWVRAPGGRTWPGEPTHHQDLRLRLREYDKATGDLLGSARTAIAVTSGWQRALVTYTPVAPGASTLDFTASVEPGPDIGQAPWDQPGTCVWVDDASVSLAATPSEPELVAFQGFETGITGWSAAGSVLSRAAGGRSGDWSAQVANPAGPGGTCVLTDAPNQIARTASGSYTATLWLQGGPVYQDIKVALREYDKATGAPLGSQVTVAGPPPTGWHAASVSYTPKEPGASTLDLSVYVAASPGWGCSGFRVDDVAIRRTG